MADIIEILKNYFKDEEDILLAFVFGSFVSDHFTKKSDIDIAVLFNQMPVFTEFLKLKDNLSEALSREVDIVILNNASPIIKMQVLKRGIILKEKSKAIYNDFFVKTVKEYDDIKYIRKEAEEKILKGRIYA